MVTSSLFPPILLTLTSRVLRLHLWFYSWVLFSVAYLFQGMDFCSLLATPSAPGLHRLTPEAPLPPAWTAMPLRTALTPARPQSQNPTCAPLLCYSRLLDAASDHTSGTYFLPNLVLTEI